MKCGVHKDPNKRTKQTKETESMWEIKPLLHSSSETENKVWPAGRPEDSGSEALAYSESQLGTTIETLPWDSAAEGAT